jgi:hypothetical protein
MGQQRFASSHNFRRSLSLRETNFLFNKFQEKEKQSKFFREQKEERVSTSKLSLGYFCIGFVCIVGFVEV